MRKPKGGTLLLYLAAGVLFLLGIGVLSSFFCLLYVQRSLQNFADQVALSGACSLNRYNKLGLMNDLTARCRQAVYASRNMRRLAQNASLEEQMLADQLLEEDRQDAFELEIAKKQLEALSIAQASQAIVNRFKSQSESFALSLPWLSVKNPQLSTVQFGSVAGIDCNSRILNGINELVAFDHSMKFTHEDSGLYVGNIDAKLPAQDEDLSFKLCSLPALVNGTVAPARVTLPEVFRMQPKEQLHSAVKVVIDIEVRATIFEPKEYTITVVGTAAANGAQAMP